ncbi:hypothetical protein [Antarctobacter sp.]|uniref:hypothetical protein n=1 Tax=Antarctobacter sp. TaxID=1872577 RepID=UPI003A901BBD
MRTLFCSHCNGILVPFADDTDTHGPGSPRRRPPTLADKAQEALGKKYREGELPAAKKAAAPPSPPRATPLGVPA